MIAHGGSGERDVIFTLKVRPDEQSAAVIQRHGKLIADSEKSLQEQVRKEVRATALEKERAAREAERIAKRAAAEEEREQQRLHDRHRDRQRSLAAQARARRQDEVKASERAAKEQQRIALAQEKEEERIFNRHRERQRSLALQARERREQAAAEESRLERERRKSLEAQVKEQARAAKAMEQEEERIRDRALARERRLIIQARTRQAEQERTVQSGLSRAGASGRSLMYGLTEAGRGIAYSGLASERDSQAILQTVVGVESAASLVRGGLDVYSSAAEGIRGLRAAATGPGGLMAAFSSVAGAAAPAAAALAAIASVGFAAYGAMTVAKESRDGATHDTGTYWASYLRLWERASGQTVFGDPVYTKALSSDQLTAQREAEFQARLTDPNKNRIAAFEGIARDRRLGALSTSLDINRVGVSSGRITALEGATADRDRLRESLANPLHSASDRMGITEQILNAEIRIKQAREEQMRIGMADARERVAKSQEELRLQEQIVDAMQGRLTSGKVAFADMTPEEQMRAIQAKQRVDSGDLSISKDDRYLLQRLNLQGTTEAANKAATFQAEQAGFDKFFGAEERAKLGTAIAERTKLQLEIAAQQEVVIKYELDEPKIREAMQAAIEAAGERLREIAAEVAQENEAGKKRAASTIGSNRSLQAEARMRN